MSERLASFLTDLSNDPFKRDQFRRNPEAFLEAIGLETDDQRLLLNRDAVAIRRQFGVELASDRDTEEVPPSRPPRPPAKKKKKAVKPPPKKKAARKPAKKKK